MTVKPSDSTHSPAPGAPTLGEQLPGTVKVQKRVLKEPDLNREKICATCGQTFQVGPDEKFFICPACYRRSQPVKKTPRKSEAQILTQITCIECGSLEYLDFVPTDVHATYCNACFSKKRQELQSPKPHLDRR